MKFILAISLLLISVICSAAIYMQSNTNGEVTYSDVPTQNSKVMNVQDAPTTQFSSPATQTTTKTVNGKTVTTKGTTIVTPEVVEHVPYTNFAITSPTDQQTFQNQRDVTVDLNVVPKIQKGDKIILLVDGKPAGAPVSTPSFGLHQLDRGTHQVSAQLVDASNGILRQTGTVTFFIHYAALGGG